MDPDVKALCLDEISNSVLDLNKKVSVKTIANNWDVSLKTASTVLEEWFENNKSPKYSRQFVVKGIDLNGNGIITTVDEKRLDTLRKKVKLSMMSLFSIEKRSESSKPLPKSDREESRMINLQLEMVERNVVVVEAPPPPSKPVIFEKEKKPIQNLFATKKNGEGSKPKPPVKQEKQSPPITVHASPKKSSPKKVQPQTNSIASFFGAGAGSKAQTKKPTPPKATVVKEETEDKPVPVPVVPVQTKKKEKQDVPKNGRDVEVVDDVIPATPENGNTKSIRKRTSTNDSGNARKRSRILQICDTDSSGDEEVSSNKKPVEKSPKKKPTLKRERSPSPQPQEKVKPKNGEPSSSKRKHKAKRMVSRTYEENGFIRTVKEAEEYSCSDTEDEPQVVEQKVEKKSPPEKAAPPAAVAAGKKGATKQGSIMSFFAKK